MTSETERLVAWLRLPAIALIGAGQRLDHPNAAPEAFAVAIILYAVWSCALLAWLYLRPSGRRLAVFATAVDVAAITALAVFSGGPYSEARLAYFLVPIAVAFRFRPTLTAVAGAASVSAYLAQAFAHPAASRPEATRFVLIQAGYLLWVAVAAVLLSAVLRRRTGRVIGLARERERLMAEVISAEERERQAVADALHDGAVQNLLAARHELDEVSGQVESPALVRADAALEETVRDLREALFELHPYVLEAAGLEAALVAAGERAARQGRFRLHLDARPVGRSPHERLLLSAVRELLVNVAKHAEATDVAISLRERDGYLVLSIRDDGNGFDEALLPRRLAEGHLGLASQKARLERVGGDLVIESAVGRGTSAEVRVPRT